MASLSRGLALRLDLETVRMLRLLAAEDQCSAASVLRRLIRAEAARRAAARGAARRVDLFTRATPPKGRDLELWEARSEILRAVRRWLRRDARRARAARGTPP